MDSEKYIGLDVHQATIVVAVTDSTGKLVMESTLETEAATILQLFAGLRGTLSVTFEEGTWFAWLYDLLPPHVDKLVMCNPRKNALLKDGNKDSGMPVEKEEQEQHNAQRDRSHNLRTSHCGKSARAAEVFTALTIVCGLKSSSRRDQAHPVSGNGEELNSSMALRRLHRYSLSRRRRTCGHLARGDRRATSLARSPRQYD
jgi:hypothetical protein